MDGMLTGDVVSGILGRGLLQRTDTDKLKSPANIIQRPSAARALYHRCRQQHLKRIQLYSQIEGLIAGNPPYDPRELERAGLSHIANFNTLDARSLYERSGLAYWNLINQASTIAKIRIKKIPGQIVDADLLMWSEILSRHFNDVVREWQGFHSQATTLSGQLVKFGVSPVIWVDERDWRWKTIELQRFFVPDQTSTNIDELTYSFVETVFTAQYLYEVYTYETNEKGKNEDSPWNIKELTALLMRRANSVLKPEVNFTDMMQVQRRLQNGDVAFDALFTDSIRIVSMLYKEYTGGVTHYMFDPMFDEGEFLFMADRQYKEISEALVIFTASPGEFTIHSNRGVGHKIFAGCQAMNQLDCSMIDMARWASTPMIRSIAIGSRDFEQIRFYPGVPTNIGTAEFVETNLGMQVDKLVGVSQYLLQKMQYNTSSSGDDPGSPDRDSGSKSAPQYTLENYGEFGVLKNSIAHFYNQGWDPVVYNTLAKMLHSKVGWPGYEAAKEFKERCIDDGVPKEVFQMGSAESNKLPRHLTVRATRVAGDGSNLARIMGLNGVGAVAGGFGEKGQRNYKREVVLAHMGEDYVEDFLGDISAPDETAAGASLAACENFMMQQGESAQFSPSNEQMGHIGSHFALLTHTIQKVTKGETDPVAADKVFAVAVPHTQEHIQFISSDPTKQEFLDSIKKSWKQIVDYAQFNKRKAEQLMQSELQRRQDEQQANNEAMNAENRKDMQAQRSEARSDFKVQSQVRRADQANQTRGAVAREKIQTDAENQRVKIQLEAGNKQQENQLKHQTEGQKILADQSTEQIKNNLDTMAGNTPSTFDLEPPTK